jgi:hypothetical protein
VPVPTALPATREEPAVEAVVTPSDAPAAVDPADGERSVSPATSDVVPAAASVAALSPAAGPDAPDLLVTATPYLPAISAGAEMFAPAGAAAVEVAAVDVAGARDALVPATATAVVVAAVVTAAVVVAAAAAEGDADAVPAAPDAETTCEAAATAPTASRGVPSDVPDEAAESDSAVVGGVETAAAADVDAEPSAPWAAWGRFAALPESFLSRAILEAAFVDSFDESLLTFWSATAGCITPATLPVVADESDLSATDDTPRPGCVASSRDNAFQICADLETCVALADPASPVDRVDWASANASLKLNSSGPAGTLIWPGIGVTPGPRVTLALRPAISSALQGRRRALRTCPRSVGSPPRT